MGKFKLSGKNPNRDATILFFDSVEEIERVTNSKKEDWKHFPVLNKSAWRIDGKILIEEL